MTLCAICHTPNKIILFLLHFSFLVILLGAFITFTTSKKGTIHLRLEEPVNTFMNTKKNTPEILPFNMILTDFQVIYYPGTKTPSDYISHLKIRYNEKEIIGQVSMNKIFSQNGYRFYQSGYDKDLKGTLLMVKTDKYGLPITYCGAILLLFSMIIFFFSKNTEFRKLLNHPVLKKGVMILFFLIFMNGIMAQDTNNGVVLKTTNLHELGINVLPQKIAQELGEVQILYRGRICPVQTFAKDFILKLYEKPTYRSLNPEQILLDWLLYPEKWEHEKIIKIKDKEVRKILGINGKYASFADFFTDGKYDKLAEFATKMHPKSKKGIIAVNEKIQLIFMLQTKTLLTVFPQRVGKELLWFSPADVLPENLPENEKLLIKGYFELFRQYAEKNDMENIELMLNKLKLFQKKKAGDVLLSSGKIKAERFYNNLNITRPIAFMNLFLGIFTMFYFLGKIYKNSKRSALSSRIIIIILNVFLILSIIGIGILLCLRGYISGQFPIGSGFLLMLSSCIMLLTLLFQRKFFLFLPFGFIFSGLVLFVSGMNNPQITLLQPVLLSPLLSIHVSLIMMAYTLFGFITLNGFSAFLYIIIMRKNKPQSEIQDRITQISVISRILLYPALFLLIAGIFVGAVWAEVSWGNYWSWDPKETWALITLLVYALAIHSSIFPLMRHPLFFHAYMLFAFLSVLMTYFGVNYLFGGMHSYGG